MVVWDIWLSHFFRGTPTKSDGWWRSWGGCGARFYQGLKVARIVRSEEIFFIRLDMILSCAGHVLM